MDPNAQPSTTSSPIRQSHLPITEAEMNPNLHQQSPSSGRNTLLTLASILVLVGVVGITLYLYIQNKTSKNAKNSDTPAIEEDNKAVKLEDISPLSRDSLKLKYGDVACRRFTSIAEALEAPSIACTLDLSGQNLSSLPKEIHKLTNLREIDLSNNKLVEYPKDLINMKTVVYVDLSNNQLAKYPSMEMIKTLQTLILKGNPLPEVPASALKPTPTGRIAGVKIVL